MSVLCDDHVYMAGADIDALCVAPRHVERAEFFTSFIERLQSEPGIRDLRVCDIIIIIIVIFSTIIIIIIGTVFSVALYWQLTCCKC